MLAVVEQQQHLTIAQEIDEIGGGRGLRRGAQRREHGRRDAGGIRQRGQLHHPHTVGERPIDLGRDADREAGLPATAGADEGHEWVRCQEPRDLGGLGVAPIIDVCGAGRL